MCDPKVNKQQMYIDINHLNSRPETENGNLLKYYDNPYDACKDSHAIAIVTEWVEFIDYDWNVIFEKAIKPVSIFDGRNILEKEKVQSIGFNYFGTGKF